MRAAVCLGVVLTMVLACQEPSTPPSTSPPAGQQAPVLVATPTEAAPPATATAPAAPIAPAAPAPQPSSTPSVSASGEELQLSVRPMLRASSTRDPLRLVIHWHVDGGPVSKQHPLGRGKARWAAARFVLHVDGPAGKTTVATGPAAQARLESSLAVSASVIGLVGPKALQLELPPLADPTAATQLVDAPWAGAAPNVSRPGTYRIRVEATLEIAGRAHSFKADPVTVQRVATHQPVSAIDKIARRAIEAHLRKQGLAEHLPKLAHAVRTVDLPLPESHRLVRFTIPSPSGRPWTQRFYEVVVTPTGKVVEILEQERFTCVARGTPIATPAGPRPVERLQPGDEVWAYDVEARQPVRAEVRAISEPRVAAVLRLAGGLSLTPPHPVYRRGSWIPAGELTAGDELLTPAGPMTLGRVESTRELSDVYELTVGPPHNYFAAGILVHNKRIAPPPGRFDVWNVLWERGIGDYELFPKAGAPPKP